MENANRELGFIIGLSRLNLNERVYVIWENKSMKLAINNLNES